MGLAQRALRNSSVAAPSRGDLWAIAALLSLFAVFVARSWLAWGHLDADYGREMVVPLRLAMGDVLYRDVRYAYGPLTPHLHAAGYSIWGAHLNVLYASGLATSALIVLSAYAVARQITSVAIAWVGAALVTVDLMFIPGTWSTFSYVFPYSYAALHGVLLVLLSLASALRALRYGETWASGVAGTCIGLALLTKHEAAALGLGIGVLFSAGALLRDGWPLARRRLTSLWLPALGLSAAGYGILAFWVSPSVVLFKGLFDPIYFGWPLSWSILGFHPGATAGDMVLDLATRHLEAAQLALASGVGAVLLTVALRRWLYTDRRPDGFPRANILLVSSAAGATAAFAIYAAGSPHQLELWLSSRYGALPGLLSVWLAVETSMVIRAVLRRETPAISNLQRSMVVAVGLVMLSRVPAALTPRSYANFALPVALLLLIFLVADRLPRLLVRAGPTRRAAESAALCVAIALLGTACIYRWAPWRARTVPFTTPRGELRLFPFDPFVPMYQEALGRILNETAPTDRILAIPAETSLYFLSGRASPTYETGLIARVRTADQERAYIEELERDRPRLILVSNRPQREYGRIGVGVDHAHRIHDWIEHNYRPDGRVGNEPISAAVWRPWEEVALPEGIEIERGIRYAELDDRDLHLDLYRPAAETEPLPVLLFFHGGGWVSGSSTDALPELGRSPSSAQGERRWPSMLPYLNAGVAVVSPEYRLAKEARAPAAVDDALSALDWIREHGEEFGLDPQRIAVIGPSAGGHLALMVGMLSGGETPVAGIIDLYGPSDVARLAAGRGARRWARRWVGGGTEGKKIAREMSPLAHVRSNVPPVLIIHSPADDVVPYMHSVRLERALRRAGASAKLVTLPGAQHGFMTDDELATIENEVSNFLVEIGLLDEPSAGRDVPQKAPGTDSAPAAQRTRAGEPNFGEEIR